MHDSLDSLSETVRNPIPECQDQCVVAAVPAYSLGVVTRTSMSAFDEAFMPTACLKGKADRSRCIGFRSMITPRRFLA